MLPSKTIIAQGGGSLCHTRRTDHKYASTVATCPYMHSTHSAPGQTFRRLLSCRREFLLCWSSHLLQQLGGGHFPVLTGGPHSRGQLCDAGHLNRGAHHTRSCSGQWLHYQRPEPDFSSLCARSATAHKFFPQIVSIGAFVTHSFAHSDTFARSPIHHQTMRMLSHLLTPYALMGCLAQPVQSSICLPEVHMV